MARNKAKGLAIALPKLPAPATVSPDLQALAQTLVDKIAQDKEFKNVTKADLGMPGQHAADRQTVLYKTFADLVKKAELLIQICAAQHEATAILIQTAQPQVAEAQAFIPPAKKRHEEVEKARTEARQLCAQIANFPAAWQASESDLDYCGALYKRIEDQYQSVHKGFKARFFFPGRRERAEELGYAVILHHSNIVKLTLNFDMRMTGIPKLRQLSIALTVQDEELARTAANLKELEKHLQTTALKNSADVQARDGLQDDTKANIPRIKRQP